MPNQITRRQLFKYSALAAGALAVPRFNIARSAQRPINVGCIAVGGRGGAVMDEVTKAGGNIAALCDVDARHLANAARKHPQARTYADYRQMLEKEAGRIDAVTVGTPDHHHYLASMLAINLGKHVYCEKPLTHSIWESRELAAATRRAKVATQMGTQGHANEPIRLLTEWLAADAIGAVKEVHLWTDRPAGWWPQGIDRPTEQASAPGHLDWDLWLGPAPIRPYHPAYAHFKWRGWWDFGTGALGDIGCHSFDLPWTALKLTAPTAVEATSFANKPECGPLWSDITYEFPASGDRPALKLHWHDGRNRKTAADDPAYEWVQTIKKLAELPGDAPYPENGQLYIGEKGKLYIGGGGPRLVPESAMQDFARPEKTIPRNSLGHQGEWLACIRSGELAGCNFGEYSGPLCEAVLLGNLAVRLGKRIEWDSAKLKAPNAPEADPLIRRAYRDGWRV
jgi:predicted dehydrogenase